MVRDQGRAKLLAEISRLESLTADWESRRAAATERLESLQRAAGAEAFEDPAAGTRIARDLQAARDELSVAEKALVAARPKVDAARVAVLEHDAKIQDRVAAARQHDLDVHQKRTDELVALLEEHECVYVPERQWARAYSSSNSIGAVPTSCSVPKSDRLRDLVGLERLRADIIRDVAAGVDPRARISAAGDLVDGSVFGVRPDDLYPPVVWGPDAVIPAPRFLDAVAAVMRRLADHDAELEVDDEPLIAKRQAKIDELDAIGKRAMLGRLTEDQQHRRDFAVTWIADRRAWRETAGKRRAVIVAELAALVGAGEADRLAQGSDAIVEAS